jgi:uncharacterized OB-fold protein
MQRYSSTKRPLPLITPIAEPYFNAAKDNRLLLQCCPRDGFFFYPRERCPHCLQTDWRWQAAQPKGTLYSFTVERMGQEPGMRALTPFAIAMVDLDEGPRLVGNVKTDDLAGLSVGARVALYFEQLEGAPLLYFCAVNE